MPQLNSTGLFFEHFEKTQGLPEKNSRPILGKKNPQGTGVNLGFWPKNSRKIDCWGTFLEWWQPLWSLLFLN